MTNNLLLYNGLIPSVRLCGYEQLNYLSEIGKINFQHCATREITKDQIKNSDVVFMVRSDSYLEVKLVRIFKKANKYLVYVLDDDLLNVPEGITSSGHYRTEEVKKRITSIMTLCDCLLSPSKKILEKYGDSFKKTGLIEEPALCYKTASPKESNQYIKIGFAGSTDRGADIDSMLTDVIKMVAEKYEDKVKIEFFGAKPKLFKQLNLAYYPYEDNYEDYQKKMWELNWDIGLAPMPDTEFHRCKHYNKYIEYAANNIIGIYSNIYPYTEVVKDGENGFLCNNTKEEWIKKIFYCIENYDKLDLVRKKIKNNLVEKFTVKKTSDSFAEVIPEVLHYKANPEKLNVNCYLLYILKFISFIKKVSDIIRINGVKTPIIVWYKFINYMHK